jgi:hypothetical protein
LLGAKPGHEVDEAWEDSLREPGEYRQGDEVRRDAGFAAEAMYPQGRRRPELRGSDLVPVPEKGVRVHLALDQQRNARRPGGNSRGVPGHSARIVPLRRSRGLT